MNKIDPERPVMQERSEVSRFDCVCISVFGVQNGGEARALGPKVLYEPNWLFSTVLHGVEVSRLDCVCPYVLWCPETCMARRKRSDRKPYMYKPNWSFQYCFNS